MDGDPSACRSSREMTETGCDASSGVPGIHEPVTVTEWLKVSASCAWCSCEWSLSAGEEGSAAAGEPGLRSWAAPNRGQRRAK